MMDLAEFKTNLYKRYAWPGGYPLFLAMVDGAALCPDCAEQEQATIKAAILNKETRNGWHPDAWCINWEDAELYCDHCDTRIESAYAEKEEL